MNTLRTISSLLSARMQWCRRHPMRNCRTAEGGQAAAFALVRACHDVEKGAAPDAQSREVRRRCRQAATGVAPASPIAQGTTVDEGRLWVMGDHRSASADSKVHMGDQYSGTIGVDDVIGKAAMIVWPVSRFGLLDSPDIQGTEVGAAPAAATAAPYAVGLAGAVPFVAWRRSRSRDDD